MAQGIRRTNLQLAAFATFLVTLSFARHTPQLNSIWPAVLCATALFFYRQRSARSLVLITLAALSVGLWRGGVYALKLQAYEPYYDHKVSLSAKVLSDGIYGSHSQLSFDASQVQIEGQPLTGTLRISGFGATMAYAGNEVQVTGKLRRGLGQYQGFVSFGQISVMDSHTSVIASVRRKFIAGLQTALPEPLASFAGGLLIGQRSTLPASVKQDLLMVGLTHVIAVSGYNVTIMLRASQRLMGKRSKRLSTAAALGLMAVFLLITGSSASIVRAAIVSGISIWAAYYGRALRPLNLILLAAAITAFINPFYIWSDAGWYLSFLAFFGVLVLAPAISRNWTRRWRDSMLAMVALESISAELMTLPYVIHTFGQMSLIGLPTNVLVVTLVPLAMLASVCAGVAGMLSAPLTGWLAWPAVVVLTYMLDVAHVFAGLPHVFLQHIGLSSAQMLGLYACVAAVAGAHGFKTTLKNSIITDKKMSKAEGVIV